MAWDREAPFDKAGRLLHYANPKLTGGFNNANEWRLDYKVTEILTFKRFVSAGRSSKYSIFENMSGLCYPMFLADLAKVLPYMVSGSIGGVWTPCKRGMNYGISITKESLDILESVWRSKCK